MKKETILGAIAALCIAFASPVCVYADAAPTITILKGNPSSPTDPPYTFTFRVSDSEGITSIKVNGRELGANGADEYDIDWSTSYNGTFTLTATNTNGGTSSKNLELTNIRSGAAAGASRPAEIPAVTAAPTPAATTAPATQAPQTAPATQAVPPTTRAAATTQAAPTQAPTETQTEPESTAPETESSLEEYTEPESESAEESMEESTAAEETLPESEPTTEETETVEETEEEYPPDSYRLYPGGKTNRTIPYLLATACLFVSIYCVITLSLNKKRLRLYKELLTALERRKKHKRWE